MVRQTQVSTTLACTAEAAFAQVSDHRNTDGWVPKVKRVVMLEDGTPVNGLGAVRQVTFRPLGWGTIVERITAFDASAHTFSYTITHGMPGLRSHLGTLTVTPEGEGCRLTWTVRFDFNPWLWAPFATVFVRVFTGALEEGLSTLQREHAA